ncbi:MAG TPA: acetyl-CoA carboxylase biotin carboxylase subunit [Candidatus Thermoplasmatota archaeon]|nr:acetyl-CoA carboxylase biotin carboxylase subunit [Candidatus Thermoplasmatota archaeon]
MFDKILVANRGEIALRVIRTAREMGIRTAAVYSEADAKSSHIRLADEAYYLGDGPSRDTYLNADKILDIATENGADAIHPGYGFLSEKQHFVEKVSAAGIKFIGPPVSAMQAMGNKIAAKKSVHKLGLPVTPGAIDLITDPKQAEEIAREVGYPVIIKAAGGGGGMGIVVAQTKDDLLKAMKAASAVAEASFGDGSVFVEKFLDKPRHIEIQVLADEHGNVVHYGERECSIQRRFQKLVEESPSPVVTPEIRAEMGRVATRAAQHAGYQNAGTVEMMWSEGKFYFNEMNVRLQVEHPVTEMVYRVDLVREQIRVAAGEKLGYTQDDIDRRLHGSAVEVRINAEDPYRDFLPTPGRIDRLHLPGGPGVRVDTHIYDGYEIPTLYDSMIAKVIAWSGTRPLAIARMTRALKEFDVGSLVTTVPFHKVVMKNEAFQLGELSTGFVKDQKILERLIEEDQFYEARAQEVAVAILAALEEQPGGAAEYARRHAPVVVDAPQDGGAATRTGSRWAQAARLESLRRR